MFQNIGFTEILLIIVVGLLLFGPQKLPEFGRALGRTIHEFKKGARELLTVEPEAAKPANAAAQEQEAQEAQQPAQTAEPVDSGEGAAPSLKPDPVVSDTSGPSRNPKRLPD